jgi:3-hydroxyanthranilate 3,4-dioxygenase
MIVGGPNTRTDYHVQPTEEWFYQLKGSMTLKIVEGHTFKDVHIHEGEHFLLPANTPHSPQRFPGTVGLVMEAHRPAGADDTLRWYCRAPDCGAVIHQASFYCTDLGSQLVPVILGYYASEEQRTCPRCGVIDQRPEPRTTPPALPTAADAAAAADAVTAGAGLPASAWVVLTGSARVDAVAPAPVIDAARYPAPRSLARWLDVHADDVYVACPFYLSRAFLFIFCLTVSVVVVFTLQSRYLCAPLWIRLSVHRLGRLRPL